MARIKDPKKIEAKIEATRRELTKTEALYRLRSGVLRQKQRALKPLKAEVKKLRDKVCSLAYRRSLLFSDLRRAKEQQRAEKQIGKNFTDIPPPSPTQDKY